MAPDRTPLHLVLSIDKGEHRGYVVHDRRNGHLGADGPHAAVLGAALLLHIGSIDRIAARAVIEIGQQHVIADGAEPARHVLELLADTVRVHQKEDGRRWSVAFGMADEGLHLAVFGRDFQRLFDQLVSPRSPISSSSMPTPFALLAPSGKPGSIRCVASERTECPLDPRPDLTHH